MLQRLTLRSFSTMNQEQIAPLAPFPFVTAEVRRALLAAGRGPAVPRPATPTVFHGFAEGAARTPGAVAVESAEERLTYGELAARAGRLGHHLKGLGAGPERIV